MVSFEQDTDNVFMISILHPSRSRPHKSIRCLKAWFDAGMITGKYEFIISLDKDDPELSRYHELYDLYYGRAAQLRGQFKLIENKNRSAVDAINNAAKVASADIMIVVSDDTEPCQFWYKKVLEFSSKKDWIIKTQDGIQSWIITMPIMDRAYYNRFGYIYHPDYLHMFCDTELTCVADITGRKLISDLLFPHKHYSVTKEAPDAVNRKADATWAQGEKLFLDRYKRNFDLPKGLPIRDQGMINWLQNKAR